MQQGTSVAEDGDVVIRVGTVLEPDGFNPFSMTTGISYAISWMMYEMLYTIGPDMNPYPQLAQSYDVSEDGCVWTYHLTQESYWHDGIQVTAHDVSWTFNTIKANEKDCGTYSGYLQGIETIEAVGDFDVRITTEEAKATMLSLTIPILPEHLWSAVEEDGKLKTVDEWSDLYFPNGPIGSGPLILDDYSRPQGYIRMLKHGGYHLGEINVDEVLFRIYNNEDSMVTAIETSDIDVAMGVPAVSWNKTLEDPDITGQEVHILDLTEFGFNCAPDYIRFSKDEKGHLNFPDASTNLETTNLSVRKAVAMATDKTQIVSQILQGFGEEGDSLIPTATDFWHYYVPEEEKYNFDLEAANQLLEDAGYRYVNSTTIRENVTSGVLLDFDFYYISTTYRDQLTADKMAGWMEEIGINAPAQGVPEGTLYNMWFNMEYDMFIWNWQPDVDPTFLLGVLTTDEIPDDCTDNAAWSDAFYTNPEYDELHIQQQYATNETERQALVHRMQQIAYRDCPYIILWYPEGLYAYRTDTFMNHPNMEENPGSTPDSFWFYYEVMEYDPTANIPPTDVDAGGDRIVTVGDTEYFSGDAFDQDNEQSELTWSWTFREPDGDETELDGMTVGYEFENVGNVAVSLTVSDPDGLSSTDAISVTVIEGSVDNGRLMGYVHDTNDAAIEGARLEIGPAKTTQTSPEGYYNVSMAAGEYQVNASDVGFSTITATATIESQVWTWLNFTLGATAGKVVGTVVDAETGDPISHAKISLSQDGDEKYLKLTGDDGYFEILTVAEGAYDVTITALDYETNETQITVIAGTTETLDIALYLEKSSGVSALAAAGIAAVVIAAVAAALLIRKKRGKSAEDGQPPPDDVVPPE